MDNILINFVANTEGLAPVETALEKIVNNSSEVGDAWKKTSDEINKGAKSNNAETSKLAKGIESLATAAKTMDKAIIGGAYKDFLKQIQVQLGLTNKELVKYIQNAKAAAQELVLTGTAEEAEGAAIAIEVMNEQLAQLEEKATSATPALDGLKDSVKQAKEEYLALINAGITSGPAFDAAKAKLAEVSNQAKDLGEVTRNLGSDTRNIDGLISLAGGIAGGFAVAQGSMALFGDESEDVQKALLKVNAAMSVLQGLQEIQNVLSKTSAANLLFNTSARQANVVAQGEQAVAATAVTVAEGAQVVATEAATVATAQLNATMALNPVGLIVAGTLALVAAFSLLSSAASNTEGFLSRQNDVLKQAGEFLEEDIKGFDRYNEKIKAMATERGAVGKELMKLDIENGNRRLRAIDEQVVAIGKEYNKQIGIINKINAGGGDVSKKVLEGLNTMLEKQLELRKRYQEERNALEVKAVQFRTELHEAELRSFILTEEAKVLATRAGSGAERNAQIEEIRTTQAARIELAKKGAATEAEAAAIGNKIIAQDNREIEGIQLRSYQVYLKGRTSLFEAYAVEQKTKILKNQVDTIESINALRDAEITALKKQRDEALKSDPNLTKGERAKIVADANLAILQLEKENQEKILAIQKSAINAKLILAEKGTKDEYDLKIAALDAQQAIELAAAELTAEQVAEIKARRDKAAAEALRSYNEQLLQDRLNLLDAELNQVNLSEEKRLEITLKRLEEQRALEISQAQGNAAAIKEINSKFDKETVESKRATANAILEINLRTLEIFSFQSIQASKRIIEKATFTDEQKIAALKRIQDFENQKLDLEEETLKKLELSEQEYNLRLQDIQNRRAQIEQETQDAITDIHKKETVKRQALLKTTFDILQTGLEQVLDTSAAKTAINELIGLYQTLREIANSDATDQEKRNATTTAAIVAAQQLINQLFADSAAQRAQALQDELSAIEESKQKELSAENLTAQQRTDINNRYREKEKQAKRQAWIADKEAKKGQAIINGLLAVVNAFATYPWPASLLVAGIVGGLTAFEVGQINSVPVPQFKKGKVKINGPGTGTSDSIPARISKGESVINAAATDKWEDALQAINSDKFEHYLADMFSGFVYPEAPADMVPGVSAAIDYDKLAVAVAERMRGIIPPAVNVHNTIDSNGLHQFFETEHTKREVLANRYSMTAE